MRLGAPVTAVSLSPSLDMLATTHTDRRGIYLWSNQAVFGNPADFVTHSEEVVDLSLPTVGSGQDGEDQDEQGASSSGDEVGGGQKANFGCTALSFFPI